MTKTHYKALLEKVLLGFLTADDPVQAVLEWAVHQMMLIEAENKVGAEKGKHSKDRKTHFSGVRVRLMDTRLGTIYLYIPKLRKGGYVPFFVTERKRSEMALAQEAFINGVSTRRIERLARALGVENISASQVSEINKELEGQVQLFRTRPLEEEYPFLMIDAHYDKVCVEDRVMALALMISHGVNNIGIREILAVEPMFDESEDSWRAFFQNLKKARPAAGESAYLGRSCRHPGGGEKGAPGYLLATLQGPLHAEHPGQGPAQGKAVLRCPSETDLAPTG